MDMEQQKEFFPQTVYSFGTMTKEEAENAVVNYSFPLNEGVNGDEVIVEVQKTCGNCTTTKYNKETNSIDVEVTVAKMGGFGQRNQLTSTVNVHINEGVDRFVIDPDTKISSANPEYKSMISLRVVGVVSY